MTNQRTRKIRTECAIKNLTEDLSTLKARIEKLLQAYQSRADDLTALMLAIGTLEDKVTAETERTIDLIVDRALGTKRQGQYKSSYSEEQDEGML